MVAYALRQLYMTSKVRIISRLHGPKIKRWERDLGVPDGGYILLQMSTKLFPEIEALDAMLYVARFKNQLRAKNKPRKIGAV